MKRSFIALLIVILALAAGSPANAQTATSTPGPICGEGYYEQTASCVIYSANWTTTSSSGASGGDLKSTTTVGANLSFRMYGTTLVIYRTTGTTGTTANFCVDASCQTISFNSGTTVNMAALSFSVACLNVCTISITHNGSGGSGVNLDSFAIYANQATETDIPTATPITPAATWTNQVITPLATWTNQVITPLPTWTAQVPAYTPLPTWTAQPYFATPLPTWTAQIPATWTAQPYFGTPLPTWTAQGRSQYILTGGLYEERDAGLNFVGSWSLDLNSSYSSGALYTTTSQSDYMTFTYNGHFAAIGIRKITTGDDIEVCTDGGSCTTYDGNGANAFNASLTIATNSIPGDHTVIVRKATNNSNLIYIDRVTITGFDTPTPILPLTEIPQFTQIAPLTEIPQFTQIPPLTAAPQFTQQPFPTPPPYLTMPPYLTAAPQFTQQPFPTPLDTWTAQPGGYTQIPPLTQIPYPTPLDTWTPQAVVLVITMEGTGAILDWNGLLTIFPTLITQVPPSSTPTETLTPSITSTATETGTPTPPGYIQLDLPNAEGTTVATGTILMSATAGEVGNIILLFLLSMLGLTFIVRAIFEGRKAPL